MNASPLYPTLKVSLVLLVGIAALSACSDENKPTPPRTFTVNASGSHVTLTPTGAVTVQEGATQAFSVTADTDYTLTTTVGGDCPPGTWAEGVYTTGAIASDCSLSFGAAINTFEVSPTGDNVTFSPGNKQRIEANKKASFTVTASTGYTRSSTVLGTCPQGAWEGDVYTTGAIVAGCSLKFSATLNSYAVTTSGEHVTIAPAGVQTVEHGKTVSLTVTTETGYSLLQTVGGTCAAGTWSDNVYTTGAITSACTVEFSTKLNSYLVTTSGTNLTIAPAGAQQVWHGNTLELTVTPDTGYTIDAAVTGSCPAGTWQNDTYTTGAVTEPCNVEFSATLNAYTVTTSGSHVTVTSSGDQSVNHGDTLQVTVSATEVGYTLSQTVGGTCAVGSWNGNVYTTGVITGPCTVEIGATLNTYAVSSSGTDVTISPAGDQLINHGATASFTVTAADHHTLSNTVGGTCVTGSWAGNVYTTGIITAPCLVTFSAPLTTYQVTSSGTNVGISPSSAQTIGWGNMLALTVTGNTGYDVSTTVGGTCAAGSWSGNVYTTGAITGACTVTFSGALKTYSVTSSGTNVTINPSGARTVNHGSTLSYTITPDANYNRSNTVTGTCPAGTWNSNVYTTGAITGACTVGFSATLKTYAVTLFGVGVTLSPSTNQSVNHGSTLTVSVTADSGTTRSDTVRGNCPAGTWSGNNYTTGTITADCTLSFATKALFVFGSQSYLGSAIGNRAAATTKCQQSFAAATGAIANLHCSSYAPILGYSPNGVTDLATAASIPTNQPVYAPNGTKLANDWSAFLNLSDDFSTLFVSTGMIPNVSGWDIAWAGIWPGGGVYGQNCSDWSSSGYGRGTGNIGWQSFTLDCATESRPFICTCWTP